MVTKASAKLTFRNQTCAPTHTPHTIPQSFREANVPPRCVHLPDPLLTNPSDAIH